MRIFVVVLFGVGSVFACLSGSLCISHFISHLFACLRCISVFCYKVFLRVSLKVFGSVVFSIYSCVIGFRIGVSQTFPYLSLCLCVFVCVKFHAYRSK